MIKKIRNTSESHVEEARLYVKMHYALSLLNQGEEEECKNLLEEGKIKLDSMTDVSQIVYGAFYWVSSKYHKARLEFEEEYRTGLLHLSYRSLDHAPDSVKLNTAFGLSLSALLGDNIYDVSELLAHPTMKCLLETKMNGFTSSLRHSMPVMLIATKNYAASTKLPGIQNPTWRGMKRKF